MEFNKAVVDKQTLTVVEKKRQLLKFKPKPKNPLFIVTISLFKDIDGIFNMVEMLTNLNLTKVVKHQS
jgi:hypothetical protein